MKMDWTHSMSLWIDRFLAPIDDPGSRLFHWNILVAILLILFWVLKASGSANAPFHLKKILFRKKYWWNRSTKRDYQIYFFNSVLKVLLLVPLLDFSFEIARFVSEALVEFQGDFAGLTATTGALALFTVFSFVFDDFLRFFHHYLMHKIPFLWKLHSTHHSAKVLTPITLYRTHPLESAIATLRNSLSLGVSAGVFVFLFESQLSLWTIAGVNVFGFLFNLLGANLRHSHIPLRFPAWLESVFISPLQHQIHHSSAPEHRNRNFGVSLAVWDRLFKSWVSSENTKALRFGLGSKQSRSFQEDMLWPVRISFSKNREQLQAAPDVTADSAAFFTQNLKRESN